MIYIYTLRVQVPNNHILTQNLYYNYYYPKPKYLIIGYMDPLGYIYIYMYSHPEVRCTSCSSGLLNLGLEELWIYALGDDLVVVLSLGFRV